MTGSHWFLILGVRRDLLHTDYTLPTLYGQQKQKLNIGCG